MKPLPVHRSGERIESLDVLRGLALLGMFIVHFHVRTTEPGGVDEAVRTFIWRLVESKAHGTFALLFGAGFAVQLRRAEARGHGFGRIYLRRLAVLALFGFAAHAFFGYNVLIGYAVWGVPLLLIRRWSTRALLVTAALSAASLTAYHAAASRYLLVTAGPDAVAAADAVRVAAAADVNRAVRTAAAEGTYPALVAARLRHMAWFYTQPFFFMPNATLALFIAGLLLVRHRVFERVRTRVRLLAGLAAFGVFSWAADNWLFPLWAVPTLGLVRDQWLTFTYVGGLLIVLSFAPAVSAGLRPVANAGRMALTNYLVQIAALDILFSAYAFNVQQVRPVLGLAAAVGCFTVEAAASTVWLRRFEYGPAEWLWRSLTYGRLQPMRRSIVGVPPVSVSLTSSGPTEASRAHRRPPP